MSELRGPCLASAAAGTHTAPPCVANQGRLEIAAAGGADQRSAKNADRPINQSREAHHSAWPLHSPEGHTALGCSEPAGDDYEATRRSAGHGLAPIERPTRSHARVGMTLPPAASAGYDAHGRGTSNVLSYRYATSQNRAIPDTPRPTLLLSRAISALTARGPFASHSTSDVVACNGSGR
jgi:hypothetical protein